MQTTLSRSKLDWIMSFASRGGLLDPGCVWQLPEDAGSPARLYGVKRRGCGYTPELEHNG